MYRVELKVEEFLNTLMFYLLFLMYRVELKAISVNSLNSSGEVPNVPCGVERNLLFVKPQEPCSFLMYRVELKVTLLSLRVYSPSERFLMHRVELKVWS